MYKYHVSHCRSLSSFTYAAEVVILSKILLRQLLTKPACYVLDISEDEDIESSPEETEDNPEEEDLPFEDNEGMKCW